MKPYLVLVVLTTIIGSIFAQYENIDMSGAKVDAREVKCLVCKVTLKEMLAAIALIDPRKRVEVSGFRIDSKGNTITKTVQYSKSETYLTELAESVCDTLDDYVKARYKASKQLTILKMTENGGMNPEMSLVDFIQDGDLNKSLKHYCLEILDDHEEAVLKSLMEKEVSKNIDVDVCTTQAKYCNDSIPEEEYVLETPEEDSVPEQDSAPEEDSTPEEENTPEEESTPEEDSVPEQEEQHEEL